MSCTRAKTRSTLHIEVRLKPATDTSFVRTDLICEQVAEWLSAKFVNLKLNQHISDYGDLELPENVIESINVVDYSGFATDNDIYRLEDLHLDVQAYELGQGDEEDAATGRMDEETQGDIEPFPRARITRLPSKTIDGLWDSLIFKDPISSRLLRFLTRMMTLSKNPRLDLTTLNWNRLILLHGPPGTGKTTLCRALAQKLTIRMGRHFTQGKLVEINCQSLLSKWFSESGKLVGKTFSDIQSLADEDETLICVLIDEVESLTGSREKASNSNECSDSLRATNSLLTALDAVRTRSNVIVLCTSNLISAIDSAFMDRVDIKQYIPNPCAEAAYVILRSCLNELIRCDLIVNAPRVVEDREATDTDWNVVMPQELPKLAEVHVHLWNQPHAPGMQLWLLAKKCQGISGRTLRRLPFLAIALHTYGDSCSVDEALSALSSAIEEELSVRSDGTNATTDATSTLI